MLTENRITVSADPAVDLFVTQAPGPADHALLVIHGGPDWDHSYLREPLDQLAGTHRVIWPDLRGCGRSTTGLADGAYTGDAVVSDLIALLDALDLAGGPARVLHRRPVRPAPYPGRRDRLRNQVSKVSEPKGAPKRPAASERKYSPGRCPGQPRGEPVGPEGA
jgi:alpha/beta hydrolase fold